MSKWKSIVLGIVLSHAYLAGCGDDDDGDDDNGGGGVDAPGATSFNVSLSPAMEVPACAAAGAMAIGNAAVTIARDDSSVTVSNLTYSGLSGPATGAHIHAGPPGVAGPIVFDLGTSALPRLPMSFTADNYPYPPPQGAPASYAAFIDMMKAGDTYVNVHTAACPAGEIRGQLD